jgi:RHS repeat-associated protein
LRAAATYHALGRRINKVVSSSGNLNTTADGDYYYYDGNRAIVEQHHPAAGDPVQQEYVFGLEYIDEAVAQFDTTDLDDTPTTETYFLLIDANYNVVALTDDLGQLVQQYRYWPYGSLQAADEYDPGPPADINPINFAASPELLATALGHQGLYHDRETGLIFNRNRIYSPTLSRYLQRDPNETALLICTATAINADTRLAIIQISTDGQYGDGLSLYQYLRSNPLGSVDPSGAWTVPAQLAQMSLRTGLIGMVFGSLSNAFIEAQFNPDATWGSIGRKAIVGGAGGLVRGAAGGAVMAWSSTGGLAALMLAGFTEGGIDAGVQSVASGRSFWEIANDSMSGALLGGVTAGAFGRLLESWKRFLQSGRRGLGVYKLGRATSTNYRATFFATYPHLTGKVVVHHGIEQQVLRRYPGRFTEAEIHSLENLRGIPKSHNPDVHLSEIRRQWNAFYREFPNASRESILEKAAEIDSLFGPQFTPPVGR